MLVSPSGVSGGVSRRSVGGGVVAGDILKFLLIDDQGEASVETSPICCFH